MKKHAFAPIFTGLQQSHAISTRSVRALSSSDSPAYLRGLLVNTLTVLLLAVYTIGSMGIKPVHLHIHAHEHEHLHSEENEQNSCHVAIYHQGEGRETCDHESHVSSEQFECAFCELLFQTEVTAGWGVVQLPDFALLSVDVKVSTSASKAQLANAASRGPPYFI